MSGQTRWENRVAGKAGRGKTAVKVVRKTYRVGRLTSWALLGDSLASVSLSLQCPQKKCLQCALRMSPIPRNLRY